jgi:hypothetical protein
MVSVESLRWPWRGSAESGRVGASRHGQRPARRHPGTLGARVRRAVPIRTRQGLERGAGGRDARKGVCHGPSTKGPRTAGSSPSRTLSPRAKATSSSAPGAGGRTRRPLLPHPATEASPRPHPAPTFSGGGVRAKRGGGVRAKRGGGPGRNYPPSPVHFVNFDRFRTAAPDFEPGPSGAGRWNAARRQAEAGRDAQTFSRSRISLPGLK